MHIFHHSAMEKMVCVGTKNKTKQNSLHKVSWRWRSTKMVYWNLFKTSQV